MTEACDLTAVEARRLIGARHLAPSELLKSCIDRIESVDHAVNAMPARDFDRARLAAKRADEAVARGDDLSALHGLPIGIKDLQETEGLVTTRGSIIYRNFIPDADECIVAAVRRAGAIVIGKTNTLEFGADLHGFRYRRIAPQSRRIQRDRRVPAIARPRALG